MISISLKMVASLSVPSVVARRASRGSVGKKISGRYLSSWPQSFEWKDADAGIEKAGTPPSNWYFDSLFHDKVEKNRTFRDWQLLCRAAQVEKDGDYYAATIAGQPIVLVKQGDNYRAFYNVCRHHAAVMCDDGAGHLPQGRITCPYHGWQYTLDGRLAKAVKMKGCQNFSPKDFSLHSLPVEKLGPWLFVNLSGNSAQSLKDSDDAKEVYGLLEQSNYQNLVFVGSRSYEIQCNWKVYIDNYLDGGLHVPVAHKALSANLDLTKYNRRSVDTNNAQQEPRFYLQTCPPASEVSTASTESRVKGDQEALYIFQYPNICINRYGAWLDTNIVYPLTATSCVVHFDWFVEANFAEDKKYVEDCLVQSDVVQQEDIWLCERVQRGLQSVAYDVGRYAPSFEGGEFMFHSRLHNDYANEVKNPTATKKA
jgi:choline monooxygenase